MKINNEKNINLQWYIYNILNQNRVKLENDLKDYIDTENINFKILQNNFHLVFLFPKEQGKRINYANYYIGIKFNEEEMIIKYVVDEEELDDRDLNKLTNIIRILRDNFNSYDKDKFKEIEKMVN